MTLLELQLHKKAIDALFLRVTRGDLVRETTNDEVNALAAAKELFNDALREAEDA